MRVGLRTIPIAAAVVALLAVSLQGQQQQPPPQQRQQPQPPLAGRGGDNTEAFRFKSGVELVNVTATVSDASGRFVAGLTQDDFSVYEDDAAQAVTHFSAERVPVSLGIALDTSGSMAGEKLDEARRALDRFLYDLLGPDDEFFLYRFSNGPVLLQGWTSDRQLLSRALGRITAHGGTAMYDTVAEAIPLAQRGSNAKKALVVISDGNDTTSRTSVREIKQQIRETEVLVYAVGIDGESEDPIFQGPPRMPPRNPIPYPFPFPPGGGRRPGGRRFGFEQGLRQVAGQRGGWPRGGWNSDRVNEVALRDMTDESGGRTEIIRTPRDLNAATAGIADELSKQYYLGYPSTGKKDGRWHSIRVEVKNPSYRVRSRRGYVAS